MRTVETFAKAYKQILNDVMKKPDYVCSPRGMKINEILGYQITITNPYSNLFKNKVRSLPLNYLANELILYFCGTNQAKDFEKASNFWSKIKNDDGTINSAYGHLIFVENDTKINGIEFSQWAWALINLTRDKDSRQAVLHFNKPKHQRDDFKDFPCTMSSQFFIREDKLHMITHMRSNDLFLGVTFDFPFFMILQQHMLSNLKRIYPLLEMGNYTHISGSMHTYESDWDLINRMLRYKFIPDETPKICKSLISNPTIFNMLRNNPCEHILTDEFLIWLEKNRNV